MKLPEISLKKSSSTSYNEEYIINLLIDDLIIDENNLVYKTDTKYNIIGLKKEKKDVISSLIKTFFRYSERENSERDIVFFDQKIDEKYENIKIKYT